ncbi:hypothetical protein ACEZCY_16240 [Streptacidiphilus sp. N1-12]|uniref:Uncharacterized protein n=2 Tax=Streptacidiphilus alkalitolerans TaxID=3342712 RepID=A0ABV6WG70_9ACTN
MADPNTPAEQPLWNPDPAASTPTASAATAATATAAHGRGRAPSPSGQDGWVSGLVLFGGVVMLVDGVFAVLRGIMGIAKNNIFVTTPNYAFHFSLTSWGWIQLIIGVVLLIVAYGVLKGAAWGRFAGIFIASLSAISNLLSMPYYPLWSLIAVALDIAVVWALCVYRSSDRAY